MPRAPRASIGEIQSGHGHGRIMPPAERVVGTLEVSMASRAGSDANRDLQEYTWR
jgi:hypothetical protein